MFRRIILNARTYAAYVQKGYCTRIESIPVIVRHARAPIMMSIVAFMEPAITATREPSLQTNETNIINHNININKLLDDADSYFREGKFSECVELLQNFQIIDDPEIHWRLARSLYNLTKLSNKDKKEKCINEGYDLMKKALEKWPTHGGVHKWYAVLLDSYAGLQGVKERVRQCKIVKEHMMKAAELNPRDATAWYMLGEWCYHVADISWHERKLAKILFGEPPNSTFEEALRYFQKAEETEPLFDSNNLVMLGKTYYRLGKTEPALFYLEQAQLQPKSCDDDIIAHNEATKLLCKLKKKPE